MNTRTAGRLDSDIRHVLDEIHCELGAEAIRRADSSGRLSTLPVSASPQPAEALEMLECWSAERPLQIAGSPTTGKSTLAYHLAARRQTQAEGKWTLVFASDGSFSAAYAAVLGLNLDRILLSSTAVSFQIRWIAEKLLAAGAVDVVVVDSLSSVIGQPLMLKPQGSAPAVRESLSYEDLSRSLGELCRAHGTRYLSTVLMTPMQYRQTNKVDATTGHPDRRVAQPGQPLRYLLDSSNGRIDALGAGWVGEEARVLELVRPAHDLVMCAQYIERGLPGAATLSEGGRRSLLEMVQGEDYSRCRVREELGW